MKRLIAISSAAFLALSGPVFAQASAQAPQTPTPPAGQASSNGLDAFGQAPGGNNDLLIGGGLLLAGGLLIAVLVNNNKSDSTAPASP